jgi:hypothetical protein
MSIRDCIALDGNHPAGDLPDDLAICHDGSCILLARCDASGAFEHPAMQRLTASRLH